MASCPLAQAKWPPAAAPARLERPGVEGGHRWAARPRTAVDERQPTLLGERAMRRLALLAVLALVAPQAARANPRAFPVTGIGIGVDLPQATIAEDVDYSRDPTTVFIELPMVFPSGLRLEPELGFGMGSSAAELRWVFSRDEDGGWVRGGAVDEVRVVAGLSVGPAFRLGADQRAWLGGRVAGAARHTAFRDGRGDRLGFDWTVGAVSGGETFVLDWFSLGGEARLSFTSVDEAVVSPLTSGSATFRRGWSVGFDVLAGARFYFR